MWKEGEIRILEIFKNIKNSQFEESWIILFIPRIIIIFLLSLKNWIITVIVFDNCPN